MSSLSGLNNTSGNLGGARTGADGKLVNDKRSGADADSKRASLSYDSFLKLMVTQMKNQDPTNPMKTSEYMGQLASFSSVEQGVKTNKHLEGIKSLLEFGNSQALSQSETSATTNTHLDSLKNLLHINNGRSLFNAGSSIAQVSELIGRQIESTENGTSGVVRSVSITADGIVADLENGEKIAISEGVRVSGPAKGTAAPGADADDAGASAAQGSTAP